MGLDMYLTVSAADRAALIKEIDGNGLLQRWHDGSVKAIGENEIELVIAYWRKANAIHAWFVRTQAGGVDECQRIPVTREVLEDLVSRCKQVLERGGTEEAAKEWDLETQDGFFFGSTGYDEWYAEDLKETITQLEAILAATWPAGAEFAYEASW